jgi:hypothetical protein
MNPVYRALSSWSAAVLLAAAAAAQGAPAPEGRTGLDGARRAGVLAGMVLDVDRGPRRGAEVVAYAFETAGVPGLRSDAEQLAVRPITAGPDGRFALDIPPGLAATVVATAPDAASEPAFPALPGDALALRLKRAAAVDVSVSGLPASSLVRACYAGPGDIAPVPLVVGTDGRVRVPSVPGYGVALELPNGFAADERGQPLLGIRRGDRLRVAAASAPGEAVRWLRGEGYPYAPDPAQGMRASPTTIWYGQDSEGRPLATLGAERSAPPEMAALRVECPSAEGAVAVWSVTAIVAERDVSFTAAAAAAADAAGALEVAVCGGTAVLLAVRRGHAWEIGCADPGLGTVHWPPDAQPVGGVVRDGRGLPVGGVRLRVRPAACRPALPGARFPGVETFTRATGTFVLPCRLIPGPYELLAMAADGRRAVLQFEVGGDELRPLAVALPDGASISGQVFDDEGEPAAGAAVFVTVGRDLVPISFGLPEHLTFADREGRFHLAGLEADLPYELECLRPGDGSALVDGVRTGNEPLAVQLKRE